MTRRRRRLEPLDPEAIYPLDSIGNVPIGNYVYHVYTDSYGSRALWETTLERGHWYKIDQYLALNTPGETDRIVRGWVNQELVYDRDGWRWHDTDDR